MTLNAYQLTITALAFTALASAQNPTAAERDKAQRYLAETRKGVQDAVKGLTEAQWKFKPAPDRWSVAECVEHLAIGEDLLHAILGRLAQAPPPPADYDAARVDAMLLRDVPDRSTKYQAPEPAQPTGKVTPAAALEHFLASRQETVNLLRNTPDLRAHAIKHIVFGSLDGYEWIIAVAAHSARHTKQILEVKADPNFPAAGQTRTSGVN
jgi:hypothetical protein